MEIEFIKNIKKIEEERRIYDIDIKFKDDKEVYPTTIDLDKPKELKFVAEYMINNGLVSN